LVAKPGSNRGNGVHDLMDETTGILPGLPAVAGSRWKSGSTAAG